MDNQYIIEYYNRDMEDNRMASKCGSVEFITTMHYILKYLKPGNRVLDVGAGTGRYTHAIAGQGYEVDAVELVEHNIDVFKKNMKPDGKVTITQGNAIDLSFIPDNKYDISLIFGPMYHLYTSGDKMKVLNEAIRVTKPGGILFIAYCISDPSILNHGFKYKKYSITEFIKNGHINPVTFAASSKPELIFELVRKEDIDELISNLPVNRINYVATDGFAFFMREVVDTMDDMEFDLLLRYHFATCERQDMIGLSAHTLDILRKV